MKIVKKITSIKLTKKMKIFLVLFAFLTISGTLIYTYGRYVYKFLYNHYLESKGFYFNSTTLSEEGSSHNIFNWDGVNPYQITIDVNSKKNDYIKTEEDVLYDITISCSSNVSCGTNKTSGTIRKEVSTDSYIITIVPIESITGTDVATITTTATSTSPYTKSLTTTYIVGITTSDFVYKITDSEGSKYLELELNNSYGYFEVEEAFGSHRVGDRISYVDYYNLSEEDRRKCKSAIIELNFDPTEIRLDMTDHTYLNESSNVTTITIDSYEYVNSFTFKMEANSTKKIIFYKLDPQMNYYLNPSVFNLVIDTVD